MTNSEKIEREALEALRQIVDCLGYDRNEGKSPAVRESNANIAWKIARAALSRSTGSGE